MLENSTVTMSLKDYEELKANKEELDSLKIRLSNCVHIQADSSIKGELPNFHVEVEVRKLKLISLEYAFYKNHNSEKLDWVSEVYSEEQLLDMEEK